MTDALVAVQARIGEIHSRFAPQPVRGRAGESTAGFAAALATAQDLLAPSPGVSGAAGGVAGLEQLLGLAGGAWAPAVPPGSAGAGGPGGSTAEAAVIAAGHRYLGVPYRWGGTDPSTGLDCSGFVQRVYGDVGIDLPRVSRDQARAGRPVTSLDVARPGDLVAFGSPVDHIGIYLGDNTMLVAPSSGDVVKRQEITRTPTAIRRILPGGAVGGVAGGERFAAAFAAAEATHGLPAGLLRAVAAAESGFNPSAASPAGAQGLMQLMPATARGLGVDPLDPDQAIDGAARLLAGQLERFGTVELALAAYNAGGPAVARFGGVPPYAETQRYVARVRSLLGGVAS